MRPLETGCTWSWWKPRSLAREVVGTFAAGYRFDDALAAELAGITNTDVSFLCPAVCGTSLSAGARSSYRVTRTQARRSRPTSATPALQTDQPADRPRRPYTLASLPRQELSLVLLKNWAPTAQALREIDVALAWVTAITLGVALVGTMIFSHRLTRPLRDLAAAADKIAGGESRIRVRSTRPVEMRLLADHSIT